MLIVKDIFCQLLGTGPFSWAIGTMFVKAEPVKTVELICKGAADGTTFAETVCHPTLTELTPLIEFV
jgi:hypothetical protein